MNSTAKANTSLDNATTLSRIVPSKAEGIAWCTGFTLLSFFIVMGNLLTILLFAVNKSLRKRSLFLVINMAFADLMLGTVSLPIYIYDLGTRFHLWKGGSSMSFLISYTIADTIFSQASLISAAFVSWERLYAIYWPFKHRALSMRAYRVSIVTLWALALLIASIWSALLLLGFNKRAVSLWAPYILIVIFIICGFNIGIWRKFRHGRIASQQPSRDLLNKRLTKTLMLVSILASLSWLPLVIFNSLSNVFDIQITRTFQDLVNIINYSNSFANPVLYAFRVPEFKEAWALCFFKKTSGANRRQEPATELRTLRTETGHLQLAFEQEVQDTKL